MSSNLNNWSDPIIVGKSPDTADKLFPSISTIGSLLAVLYYDRRVNPDSTLTDVYISLLEPNGLFNDIKLNTVSTDWLKSVGDRKFAMIQRNFGDYITLTVHKKIMVAVWTDARQGLSRIYSRTITIKN